MRNVKTPWQSSKSLESNKLSEWPENISKHGLFRTLVKWLKNWLEICVVEEVLASSMDETDASEAPPRQQHEAGSAEHDRLGQRAYGSKEG